MKTFASFVLALLLSVLVSQFVAQQLAVYFRTREEFIAVTALLVIFALACIAIFAILFHVSAQVVPIDRAAFAIAGFAVLAVLAVLLYSTVTGGRKLPNAGDLQISAEILFPALIVVAIQWWMVRSLRAMIPK